MSMHNKNHNFDGDEHFIWREDDLPAYIRSDKSVVVPVCFERCTGMFFCPLMCCQPGPFSEREFTGKK